MRVLDGWRNQMVECNWWGGHMFCLNGCGPVVEIRLDCSGLVSMGHEGDNLYGRRCTQMAGG
jgi:hypothetical protein